MTTNKTDEALVEYARQKHEGVGDPSVFLIQRLIKIKDDLESVLIEGEGRGLRKRIQDIRRDLLSSLVGILHWYEGQQESEQCQQESEQ